MVPYGPLIVLSLPEGTVLMLSCCWVQSNPGMLSQVGKQRCATLCVNLGSCLLLMQTHFMFPSALPQLLPSNASL